MLVKEIMTRDVITLPPTATIREALQVLRNYRIRHIPIINEDNEVIGIVSDRDVRDASPSTLLRKEDQSDELDHEIQLIMSSPVLTVHPLDFVEEIARVFYEKEVDCLPVVQDHELIGLVTQKDMLYTLIQLTGSHVQSSVIEVKVPDIPGMMPKVSSIFARRNINIASVLVYPYRKDPAYKILVFRIETMNPLPFIQDLRQAGYQLLWPNNIPEPKV